jgi:hypothetical protein
MLPVHFAVFSIMPYIKPSKRDILDPLIAEVAAHIIHTYKDSRAQAFYDAIYYLVLESRGDGRYRNWNELSGVLMCAAGELRRRITCHIPATFFHDPQIAEKRWGPFPKSVSEKTPLGTKLLLEKLALAIVQTEKQEGEEALRKTLALKNIPHPHEPIIDAVLGRLPMERAGNLNYTITRISVLMNPANDPGDWLAIESILAGKNWMPHRLFHEIYLKFIGEYEDKKIAEFGDVFPPLPDVSHPKTNKKKRWLGIF